MEISLGKLKWECSGQLGKKFNFEPCYNFTKYFLLFRVHTDVKMVNPGLGQISGATVNFGTQCPEILLII